MQDKSITADDRAGHAVSSAQSAGPDLCAIVYVSKAARPVTRGDLTRILERSLRRNLEENLTGVLLYADGSFMQYLEGPAVGLLRVYGIIKTDPLHYGLIDLVREPIRAREFAEWSMACHVVGTAGESSLTENYALLSGRLAAALRPKSAACELLSSFWAVGGDSVAPALLKYSEARARRLLPASPGARTAD